MDIIVLGGNNHRAEVQAVMAAMAASGINCIFVEDEKNKAIEFKCSDEDLSSMQAIELKPQEFSRPEIKRGKGKVRRW